MRPDQREYWERELRTRREPLRKPIELLRRAASSEDFIDTAVIAGFSVSDIVAGKIAESQIPHDVLEAFHDQYPRYGSSFVEAVNHLRSDPERLAGLINGVKGKLFEVDYAAWLNHGQLPIGWTAALAHSANNPAWDVVIRDNHGQISQLLQNKATATLDSVREAIAAHPNIDVVVPHELYNQAATHPELVGHVIDGHGTLSSLNDSMAAAQGHATDAGLHFPVIGPLIAIGLIAGQNYMDYRKGRKNLEEAVRNVQRRGALAIVATSGYWATTVLSGGNHFAGISVSVLIRTLGNQRLRNHERQELMKTYINSVRDSRLSLRAQTQRPLLEATAQG